MVIGQNQALIADAAAFGLPGAALASHDGNGITFQRIVDSYNLSDPAIKDFARLVERITSTTFGVDEGDSLLAIAKGTWYEAGAIRNA